MALLIFMLGLVMIWTVLTGRFTKLTDALFHPVQKAG